jgi:hypothetical protein
MVSIVERERPRVRTPTPLFCSSRFLALLAFFLRLYFSYIDRLIAYRDTFSTILDIRCVSGGWGLLKGGHGAALHLCIPTPANASTGSFPRLGLGYCYEAEERATFCMSL